MFDKERKTVSLFLGFLQNDVVFYLKIKKERCSLLSQDQSKKMQGNMVVDGIPSVTGPLSLKCVYCVKGDKS